MTFDMLYSKIHRATVTDANLNYVGSITIDKELMKAAKLVVGQKVEIVNINNGERFTTYVIEGKKGKRDICLNGAAARKAEIGDRIIVIAYASMTKKERKTFKPYVVLVNENNDIDEIRGLYLMFEGMDFSKMGEMLQQAQEQAQKMQEEAKERIYTAKSGGGLVSVSLNGEGEVNDITIDDSLLEDKESLQILLMSATNDAIKMVEDGKKQAATQMLSGMGGFGAKS